MSRRPSLLFLGFGILFVMAGVGWTGCGTEDGPGAPTQAPLVSSAERNAADPAPELGGVGESQEPLTLKDPHRRFEMAGGEQRSIPLSMGADEFIRGEVTQDGIDVELDLLDASGKSLLWVDTPVGASGKESFFLVSDAGGEYRLRLKAFGRADRRGRVEVQLTARRAAGKQERAAFEAACLSAEGERLRSRLGTERELKTQALVTFERAAELWRQAREPQLEARMWMEMGGVHARYGDDSASAGVLFERAVEGLGSDDDSYHARLRQYWGDVAYRDGRPAEARAHYRQAIERWPATQQSSLAVSLNDLGYMERLLGRPQQALERYGQALQIWRVSGNSFQEAGTLHNLGKIHTWLGDLSTARELMNESLSLWQQLEDEREAAITLVALGEIEVYESNFDRARILFGQAAQRHDDFGNVRGKAFLEVHRGELERRAGNPVQAIELLQSSLPLLQQSGADRVQGRAHLVLAELYLEAGDLDRSESELSSAEQIFEDLGLPLGQARCRRLAAELAMARGRLKVAAAAAEEAVHRIEALRSRPVDWLHRASFLTNVFGVFETAIEVEVTRARRRPGQGFELRALAWAERSRARAFLDRLAARRQPTSKPQGRPLDRGDLLTAVGDRTLLYYFLGDRASYLWRVSPAGIQLHSLVPRSELVGRTLALYDSMSRRPQVELENRLRLQLERLSSLLLPTGILDGVEADRLWILPDGPLNYLPFSVLIQGEGAIVDRFETVYIPSISTLVGLRQDRLRRPTPAGALILADPVYGEDPRCADAQTLPEQSFRRLPGTALEVAGILPHMGADTLVLQGFDAGREELLSLPLSELGRLHFAVHGELRSGIAATPRLALAQRDKSCRPRSAFIDMDEISTWTLNSELVVLSACGTGLGRDLRGEGLVGLTRAFLQAGSKQVAVSLWDVDDRGAARLMEAFYRRLDHYPPASALRRAQLELRAHAGFGSPFHWAPFVIYGG